LTSLVVLALLVPTAVPVEVQGIATPPAVTDTLAPIIALSIGDDSGVIPVAIKRIALPAPDKPGDPSELVLVTDDSSRDVIVRMRMVAADRDGPARYEWKGDRIGLPTSRLLVAAPVDTTWMRLSARRKLSRTLDLELVRRETGEAVVAAVRSLKRPKGTDPHLEADREAADWAKAIPNLIPLAESKEYEIPRGAWTLDRDLIVPRGATLHLRAGTTLYLAPSRNIFAFGRLIAHGTNESPVTIRPAGEGPWGVVALLGQGSAGSKLQGTHFVRGSQWFAGAEDLNGSLTLIDTEAVIDNCRFDDSRGEDAVHVERAMVTITNTGVFNAASDGIDLERSTGRIENCELRDIGDDAVDAGEESMFSVSYTMVQRAGGKGISVGQSSTLDLSESFLIESGRGISTFEGSQINASATVIAFSRRAGVQAAARRGTVAGSATLTRCLLWQNGSQKALQSDRVTLQHTRTDVPIDLATYTPMPGPAGIVIGPKALLKALPPLADYSREDPKPLIEAAAELTGNGADLDTSSWLVFGGILALLGGLLLVEKKLRH